jgi:8-oxo-dGTP diphosphatase
MDERYFFAAKALIFKDGKFLIIKRSIHARGDPYSWEFPGGALEFGESPQYTAVREVKEETSLDVTCLFPISAWTFMKDEGTQAIGVTFLCALNADGPVVLSKEHVEHAWVDESGLSDYRLSRGIAEEMRKWDWDYLRSYKAAKE